MVTDLGRKVQSAQRHAEQEPQPGHDAVAVADARARLGQVQPEAADVLKCGRVRGALENAANRLQLLMRPRACPRTACARSCPRSCAAEAN